MRVTTSRYSVPGWGVGWLALAGDVVVQHDLPQPAAGEGDDGHPLGDRFRAYFAGARDDFRDLVLHDGGWTPFQRAVLDALRRVPYGETVTYGELAALAGHPNAYRAAANVCAHNRFALVVPCHRIVAAGGLGSYGSLGLEVKRRLLGLEGAIPSDNLSRTTA